MTTSSAPAKALRNCGAAGDQLVVPIPHSVFGRSMPRYTETSPDKMLGIKTPFADQSVRAVNILPTRSTRKRQPVTVATWRDMCSLLRADVLVRRSADE
jgi:hypothetical protein